jgi:hypothetical protein
VFRKILNAALEDEVWAELGTDGIFKIHRVKLEACKREYTIVFNFLSLILSLLIILITKEFMNSLRPEYTDPEMTSSIRSKCSDVKKQFGITKNTKRSLAQNDIAGASSFAFKRRSIVNTNGLTIERDLVYPKNETSNCFNSINTEHLDESSSEYFQEIDQ